MPSARLAKALVEKRLGEDNNNDSFFEEEEEEEMGRPKRSVVAPLLEMYEREELARFFRSGDGVGRQRDDVDEAKEKDDSGEEEEEEDEDEDEDEDGEEEDAKCADCLRAAGATGGVRVEERGGGGRGGGEGKKREGKER